MWQIGASEEDDGFSYTVGVFKTYGHPEIIVFGQKAEWQYSMIHTIVDEIKTGTVFREGVDYTELLDGYACRFDRIRSIESYRNYLGWNLWYYHDVVKTATPAPVLPFVWPDKNGRYPNTPDYYSYRQPLIGSNQLTTS